ncbi:PR5-like receptor kinase [Stylosanthes scabra]|uniref:PR5-like receptor kinase n=1 Tax=Stylosanthes scabra TaxID=79078 RepID=A0ABU6SRY6_9FABA|nr:PR5-like receptor kinase [Stylosanthes scabra]
MLWRKRKHVDDHVENLIKSYGALSLKRYTYKEVKKMTNSFHEKLGEGGYGVVYKASLADGQQVAVKILKESKGTMEEFVEEVFIISRTSHVNIVSLLGFRYEKNKRALIYEFMSNDSLDKFSYRKESSNTLCKLDCNILYQISIGIARGLEYLHRGCNTRILHLDIKPQNILLDEHFCPKIADFGLAKICKKDQSIISILGTRGTPGYIAPEVFSRTYGGVSHKSDVYSYGMLILEIIGGRQNYESEASQSSESYFPDWIYKDLEQGNIPTRCLLHKEEENDIVMKMTLVSLWYIQPNPADRPSISKVIEMLEGPLESVPYPPKPVLFSPEKLVSQYSDISYSNECDTNSITTVEIVSKVCYFVLFMSYTLLKTKDVFGVSKTKG